MAVKKKTTKKAAKKTVPKLPSTTIEELSSVMAENYAKTEAAMAESQARMDARHAKTEATHSNAESSIDRLSASIDRLSEKLQKLPYNLDKSFDRISMRLERLTEMLVIPKIRQVMNSQGHNFYDAEVNALIRGVVNGRKEDIAEVDMFLSGPEEAMAVEIKTRLRENHVQDHIDQLQNLREHEEYAEIKGKKLFGALAGITVDDKARALAKKKGLYVAEIREEEEKLVIDKPEHCRIW